MDHGPLSYSLAIKERWEKYGNRNPKWPEWEVFPESSWNYGLELNAQDPARGLEVVRKPGPLPAQPFTPDTVPVQIKARARKIPNWQADHCRIRNVVSA